MHPALHGDVRVSNTGRQQLTNSAEKESVAGRHPPPLLEDILELLENGVLQDGVDDQDQRRQHAREERCRTLGLEELGQSRQRGGFPGPFPGRG